MNIKIQLFTEEMEGPSTENDSDKPASPSNRSTNKLHSKGIIINPQKEIKNIKRLNKK